MEGIKHPEDLQDRDILRSLDANRGAGVQLGEFICQKVSGEIPINFIARCKGEYSAWYNRKEAALRNANANREGSAGPSASSAVRDSAPPRPAVQGSKASLEATLEAQVDALTQEYARAESAYQDAKHGVVQAKERWHQVYADLRNAERFLQELRKDGNKEHPPEDDPEVGGNLSQEVGRGKQRSRNRVGKPPRPRSSGAQTEEGNQEGESGASG